MDRKTEWGVGMSPQVRQVALWRSHPRRWAKIRFLPVALLQREQALYARETSIGVGARELHREWIRFVRLICSGFLWTPTMRHPLATTRRPHKTSVATSDFDASTFVVESDAAILSAILCHTYLPHQPLPRRMLATVSPEPCPELPRYPNPVLVSVRSTSHKHSALPGTCTIQTSSVICSSRMPPPQSAVMSAGWLGSCSRRSTRRRQAPAEQSAAAILDNSKKIESNNDHDSPLRWIAALPGTISHDSRPGQLHLENRGSPVAGDVRLFQRLQRVRPGGSSQLCGHQHLCRWWQEDTRILLTSPFLTHSPRVHAASFLCPRVRVCAYGVRLR